MPGLGRRVFSPGEVLTATNVMGYLQDQVVQTYASSAARGSAIGTAVSEGMVSYLSDSNSLQVYTGASWDPLPYSSTVSAIDTRVTSLESTRPGTSGKPLQFSAGILTTSASAQVTVTFPSGRFSTRPAIVAQVLGHPNVTVPYIGAADANSFTIGAFTIGGTRVAATVDWHAVQMTSGSAGG